MPDNALGNAPDEMTDAQRNPYAPVAQDIIEEWLIAQDVSSRTMDAYRLGMRTFCSFIRDCGLDFDELDERSVREFRDHLTNERHLSPATVSSYLAAVRSFYRYAESQGLDNIARNVRGIASTRDFKKEALTPDQAKELLRSIKTDTEVGKRNFAILNLMLRTGLRDVEIVRADIRDIREISGRKALYVHGKGRSGKEDFVLLTEKACGPIEDYLAERKGSKGNDPLFASTANINKGGRLSTRTISQIAKDALRSIGLDDERYTAHSLRHTAITFALLGGASEREAQEMARHANITTTMIYSHHIDRMENAAEDKVSNILDG